MTRIRFPHPIALLAGCILLGAALSYVLPAGQYERREDPVTGRSVVVAGTYQVVESTPVGFFDAFVAIPRGMADRADVIFLIFLIGGAFSVIDETGALRSGVAWLVARLRNREVFVIPVVSLAFATGGVIANMQEEIIALIPTLLILTSRLGFTPLTAVSMSAGAAMVGSAFSPINPFQVGIAQNLAEVPLFSGGLFRLASLVLALALWIFATMRHARRTRTAQEVTGSQDSDNGAIDGRHAAILALVLVTFGVMVYGIMQLGWDFNQMSALFFMMGSLVVRVHYGAIGVGLPPPSASPWPTLLAHPPGPGPRRWPLLGVWAGMISGVPRKTTSQVKHLAPCSGGPAAQMRRLDADAFMVVRR